MFEIFVAVVLLSPVAVACVVIARYRRTLNALRASDPGITHAAAGHLHRPGTGDGHPSLDRFDDAPACPRRAGLGSDEFDFAYRFDTGSLLGLHER